MGGSGGWVVEVEAEGLRLRVCERGGLVTAKERERGEADLLQKEQRAQCPAQANNTCDERGESIWIIDQELYFAERSRILCGRIGKSAAYSSIIIYLVSKFTSSSLFPGQKHSTYQLKVPPKSPYSS